jgi:hypothetical protein
MSLPKDVQKRKYRIRREPLLAPLLAVFGGTARRSFVEVDESSIRFRFSWLDQTIAVEDSSETGPSGCPDSQQKHPSGRSIKY